MSFFAQQRSKLLLLLAAFSTTSASLLNAQPKAADKSIASVERNEKDHTPAVITFSTDAHWKKGQEQEIFSKYLGVDNVNTTMKLATTTTTKAGMTVLRYAQYIKGVKVEQGSYTLTEQDGLIHYISGNYYNTPSNATTTPSVTESAALGNALAYVGATKYMWQSPKAEQMLQKRYNKSDTTYYPKGQLVWMDSHADRQLHLAYAFHIYAQQPMSRQMVYIDALDGTILRTNSLIKHTNATAQTMYSGIVPTVASRMGGTYVLYDSTRGGGVYTMSADYNDDASFAIDLTSFTNVWPVSTLDMQALDAHWGAEKVYDYWSTQQGRNSYDDAGSLLMSYVHITDGGNPLDNAYWNGTEMSYGDGSGSTFGGMDPLTSLDVAAHEIGHAVCEYTANLDYEYESGAINEGLSDCWAATIENWANPHEIDAVAKSTWDIGEEISPGNPLRSMNNPELAGNPGTYGGTNWMNVVGCTANSGNDQCGVHNNSGVTNKWYYLVVTGGTGTNTVGNFYNVAGIGFTDAANILYQTELTMPQTCTYAQFRALSIAAATTYFGSPCAAGVQSITNAWYAVNVGASFVPCVPSLGFVTTTLNTSEYTATTTCPASRTINIGIKPTGLPITGGNPVVTVAAHGTAVSGVDYTLTNTSLTFLANDTSTHYATLTIFDNGVPNDSKTLILDFALSAMGSTATISSLSDTMYVNILNNDSAVSLGGNVYRTLNLGTAVTSNLTSAFPSAYRRAIAQYIVTAAEMTAAGLIAGAPINQIAFNITTKNSTVAFVGYSVSMGHTTLTDLTGGFVSTGLVNVVPATNHTTNLGIDSLGFTTNFTWNGTSNVVVQICYGSNTSVATGGNDRMSAIQTTSVMICDHNEATSAGGSGCTSLTWSGGGLSDARPVMRFRQVAPPTHIATVLGNSKTWTVTAGTRVNFYNPADTNLIATLNNESASLGCVTATVTGAGNGFTPAVFSAINRSNKEVTITPTINGATTTYDATIYLTNTELNSVAASTLYLLKTDEPTDATITSANSVLLTPTLITGTNYVGFKGTFTGFSRFFLTDGPLCTPPTALITAAGSTTFCLGSSVTLSANTGTGYTYQWQQGAVNIPGATSATYPATHGGSYTVRISQGGCTGTSAATAVNVDSAYAAPIAAATTAVCVGQQITLTDITTGGTWSSGNMAIATIDGAGHVHGVAQGGVIISYSRTNTCGTGVATSTITVNANPAVAAITGTASACVGTTTLLANSTPSGTWTSSNTAAATVTTTGMLGGNTAGSPTISYTVTNGFGCSTTQTIPVTIFALPNTSISASGPTTFCTGSSVTLSNAPGTGLTYQWQDGGMAIAGATAAAYEADTNGSYSVVITNANNCTAISTPIAVVASPGLILIPTVSVAANPGTTICSTTTFVNYTATSTNGGPAPVYVWSVNGSNVGVGTTFAYVPANGDNVQCLLTSNAACVAPDTASTTLSMIISPFVNPSVTINAIPNDTLCAGTMGTFAAIPANGGTAPTYLWRKNGMNVATGPAYNFIPANGDVLVVKMVSNFACRLLDSGLSNPMPLTVVTNTPNTVTVTANHTVAAPGVPVTFTATAPNAGTSPAYQWYLNGSPISGATASSFTSTSLVTGQVVTCNVMSSAVCASPATAISTGLSVMITNDVTNVGTTNGLVLMPNPNNGTFTVQGTLQGSDQQISIKVTDMLGQMVYTANTQVQNGTVNETIALNQSLAAGVYMVSITTGTGNAVFHVVVNK